MLSFQVNAHFLKFFFLLFSGEFCENLPVFLMQNYLRNFFLWLTTTKKNLPIAKAWRIFVLESM